MEKKLAKVFGRGNIHFSIKLWGILTAHDFYKGNPGLFDPRSDNTYAKGPLLPVGMSIKNEYVRDRGSLSKMDNTDICVSSASPKQFGHFQLKVLLFFCWWFVLFSAATHAQGEAKSPDGFRTLQTVHVVETPVIDGVLDDACWKTVDWQGEFFQLKPSPGEPARAHTRVAVAFDEMHLFVAFRCFNPTGSSANSKITRRDGNLDQDNAVTLYLDTFHSRRDCYYFSTNSIGTQIDGRIGEDGYSNDKNWDCIWRVKTFEDSLGWTAEM